MHIYRRGRRVYRENIRNSAASALSAVRAFAAGKHVVLEKPMATTLDACDRILAAAKEAGTVFMIAEQSQYWPGVVQVQQLIRGGAIGEIITAEAFFGGRVGTGWGPKQDKEN